MELSRVGDLQGHQAQVSEYKYEMDRLARELQDVKKRYFEKKRREQQMMSSSGRLYSGGHTLPSLPA